MAPNGNTKPWTDMQKNVTTRMRHARVQARFLRTTLSAERQLCTTANRISAYDTTSSAMTHGFDHG